MPDRLLWEILCKLDGKDRNIVNNFFTRKTKPSTAPCHFLNFYLTLMYDLQFVCSFQGVSSYGGECEDGGRNIEAGLWRDF